MVRDVVKTNTTKTLLTAAMALMFLAGAPAAFADSGDAPQTSDPSAITAPVFISSMSGATCERGSHADLYCGGHDAQMRR